MEKTTQECSLMDSFDKLFHSQIENNLLKKNVRASFNLESSVDNSASDSVTNNLSLLGRPSLNINQITSISTPTVIHPTRDPFECPISPIRTWKISILRNVKIEDKKNLEKFWRPPIETNKRFNKVATKYDHKKRVYFSNKTFSQSVFVYDKDAEHKTSNKALKNKLISCTHPALPPGKWRKSLSSWKRNNPIYDCENDYQNFRRIKTFVDSDETPIACHRKSIHLRRSATVSKALDFKTQVLDLCKQDHPLSFDFMYSRKRMVNCRKVGEGVFGEVFLFSDDGGKTKKNKVLKIIPIEGSNRINGEPQKTFELILPEIIISKELSNLRSLKTSRNQTNGFVLIEKISCVKGKYPSHFIKLWEEYNENNLSENDHPRIFNDNQLYLSLEMSFAGTDLATFHFKDSQQSYFLLIQLAFILGVAEKAYQFEHRDLHWGNVLVLPTKSKAVRYKLDGSVYIVPTKGVKATIIDYSLSRMAYRGCCFYNDLSKDEELFEARGDYQFDIYRMMKNKLNNKWEVFEPKTNVFWISYIVDKLLNEVIYENSESNIHGTFLKMLREFQRNVLNFNTVAECAKSLYEI